MDVELDRMFKYIVLSSALLIAACTTTVTHLSTEDLTNFSQGKVTIIFIDDLKTINYIVEVYEVLNTTYRNLSGSYRAEWESEEFITDIHTREFAKQGFNVRMFSDIYSDKAFDKVKIMHQQFLKDKKSNLEVKPTLTPEIKKMLFERQIKHFVLIDWTGFTLVIKSQGLPAQQKTTFNFKIFNVDSGDLVWKGSSPVNIPLDLKGIDGKILLEKNDFSQFKTQVKQLIHTSYTQKEQSFIQLIGIVE